VFSGFAVVLLSAVETLTPLLTPHSTSEPSET
jgi:hypothetical protein